MQSDIGSDNYVLNTGDVVVGNVGGSVDIKCIVTISALNYFKRTVFIFV